MSNTEVVIVPVGGKEARVRFVDTGRAFSRAVPNHVPQLRSEQIELVDPAKNPFFQHATVQLFLAMRGDKPVGRIAAHIDHEAEKMPVEQGFGPGSGFFGYFDAESEEVAGQLLDTAENWLRSQGVTRCLGPISLSIWEEPGLLVRGQDEPPMIMMGHHPAIYREWIENARYEPEKSLYTYSLPVDRDFPPIVKRIVKSGTNNERIQVRPLDKSRYEEEVRTVLAILNDAWSGNWGFVPFTDAEIAYAAKKMKPILHPDINRIAELDGRPVAFMMTLPDMNHVLQRIDGKLFPFGWVRMLKWLRKPTGSGMRVPLMGVLREFHNSRLASQLAFMMIDEIRRVSDEKYGSKRGEIGWILDDNKGMVAIAEMIDSEINREYVIYRKNL
ncbi:N-acetyltransferase [Altererythrobacter aurantiacus]|uniref:N-acetyltransferase n=1 Tax=Parapontixanthobacter aurantiacus TaxID=1463599 RepID=A0A844ZJJ3_9SPHN|nr:N-acetyltransferase [Parapontixanthobacter aurantiacus]